MIENKGEGATNSLPETNNNTLNTNNNVSTITSTPELIKVVTNTSLNEILDNIFITNCMELYRSYNDVMMIIIEHPEQTSTCPEYDELKRLHKLRQDNPEISPLITASMLYYFYKNISGHYDYPEETTILNEKFDKDGKPVGSMVNLEAIATFFIKKYTIITILDSIFLYKNNRYYHDPRGHLLKSELQTVLSSISSLDTKNTANTVKDLKERIMNKSRIKGEERLPFLKNSHIIPTCTDALVRYNGKVIKIPNTPATGKNWVVQAEYIENIDTSTIKEFLNNITNQEASKIIIQVGSQALSQSVKYQRCYMMLGEGGNGKSLVSKLYYEMLGISNFSVVSLQDFGDKFRSSDLCKTLMNINPDIPKTALQIGAISAIKSHTGGDYRTFEDKFETPYKDRPTTVLLFGANGLPDLPLSEDKFSWWRRWDIIEFPKTFKENSEYEEKMLSKDNVNALFKLVIDDLERLETDGLIRTNTSDHMKRIWEKSANSCYAYIADNFTIEPYELEKEDWISKNDLLKEYNEYCEDKNVDKQNKLSKDAFCKKMVQLKILDKKRTVGQDRVWMIVNLKRLEKVDTSINKSTQTSQTNL